MPSDSDEVTLMGPRRHTPTVQVSLNGFLRHDFNNGHRLLMAMGEPVDDMLAWDSAPGTPIHDARPLQALAASEGAFFEQHAFVLLRHGSAVTMWDADETAGASHAQITQIYHPEIDTLIRHVLLPGRRSDIQRHGAWRRCGPGTQHPFYDEGVQQECGLTADDYQESVAASTSAEIARRWRDRYDRHDVDGFMLITFWRTTYMEHPLKHMPLAVCDPHSVRVDDIVPAGVVEATPSGQSTRHLALPFNAGQQWFYYPDMLGSDVLAFKSFHCVKPDRQRRLQSCFQTAFLDPGTPADAEQLQSGEYRVGVFCLNERQGTRVDNEYRREQ